MGGHNSPSNHDNKGTTDIGQVMTSLDYDTYVKFRDHLRDVEREAQAKYDHALFYLSSGAIGLTITYLPKVIVEHSYTYRGLMFAALVFFTGTLVTVVLSHQVSASVHREDREWLDENWDNDDARWNDNPLNTWIGWLNALSGWCFIIGVGFLLIFAGINIEDRMEQENKQVVINDGVDKGLASPPPPKPRVDKPPQNEKPADDNKND